MEKSEIQHSGLGHAPRRHTDTLPKSRLFGGLRRKLVILVVLSLIATWIAATFDFSERWIAWSTQFEHYEIDELPFLFFFLTTGLSLILMGHHRELAHQSRLRTTLESEFYREATRDRLTGLANRNLFSEHLVQEMGLAERADKQVAVFVVSLPDLRKSRDVHGYQAVDEILITVAKRLKASLRKTDTLARFGDNEFGILQPNLPQPTSASILGQRLLAVLQKPIFFEGKNLDVQILIGATLSNPSLDSPEELYRRAAVALNRRTEDDRSRFTFFEAQMDQHLKEQETLERDLKQALKHQQFELHFQPQFKVDGDFMLGAEALLRWYHPQRGWVSPAQFIPIAENLGLIRDIEHWSIAQACRTAMQWPMEMTLAVNVSPQHLLMPGFVSRISSILKDTGLSPSRLEIEVTESILVNDADLALETVEALRKMQVRIALDDFGTGYSSLSYLRRIPFDKLKIDRSFVEDIENSPQDITIIEAVISMGASLGMDVMAEGVENQSQLALLEDAGCTQLQGYLFSKPLTPQKLLETMQPQLAK